MPAPDPIVGIDLGTTNSLVAIFDDRGPRVIPDDQGRPLLPSVVRYELADGSSQLSSSLRHSVSPSLLPVVGHDARARAAEFPHTTIASVKRLMGRSRADAAPDLPFLSYNVIEGPHNTARIQLPAGPQSVLSPQEVSAVILRELKDRASRALGVDVTRAVVTVPAYFDDAQRQATRDAGRLAGLDVVRIVNEPTAAALAYGLGAPGTPSPGTPSLRGGSSHGPAARTIAVFDLGGGTFDVSILRLIPGATAADTDFFQVLSTAGDTRLGGDDVDHLLVELFAREINSPLSAGAKQTLKDAAERAKCELSDRDQARISIDADGLRLDRTLTRAELESLIDPWVQRAIDCCQRALRDAQRHLTDSPAHLLTCSPAQSPHPLTSQSRRGDPSPPHSKSAIDSVILVGGSTRIPLVRRRVAEFFGLTPYTALDPDQVVALGAAVQAGILSGAVRGALLLDVIPLSLGIETMGGAVAKLVMKNSTIPARATEMFSTSVDGQTSIKLSVYQGEREMAADCRRLAEFHLRGLPPMPAGIPQVEVEFLVDASGVLNVSAHERRSGRRANLQVIPNHGLTREEVDRMEAESLAHAREDMTRHRIADLVVNSKLDLKWIGERFEKHRDKLDPAYAASLESQISNLKLLISAAESDWCSVDANALHAAKESLDQSSIRLQEISIAESLREDLEQRASPNEPRA